MENTMNRHVTSRDIAARLNLNAGTVRTAMSNKTVEHSGLSQRTITLIRETAKQMGYDPKAAKSWYNGNFDSKEKEISRMVELREQGYSNYEIAKKIGRTYLTVLNGIGKQDCELSRQNVAMAAHIRAQKNAARRQYVVNKPIRAHNARVEAANKKKAELEQMRLELTAMQENIRAEQPAIEQAARTKIDFPLFDLHTVQPTALQ